jgi:hypothetical protein
MTVENSRLRRCFRTWLHRGEHVTLRKELHQFDSQYKIRSSFLPNTSKIAVLCFHLRFNAAYLTRGALHAGVTWQPDPNTFSRMKLMAIIYVYCPDATTSFALQLSFSCSNQGTTFNATMSFGFSIGDFITVLQLANQIRTRFVDAPEQFKAISDV